MRRRSKRQAASSGGRQRKSAAALTPTSDQEEEVDHETLKEVSEESPERESSSPEPLPASTPPSPSAPSSAVTKGVQLEESNEVEQQQTERDEEELFYSLALHFLSTSSWREEHASSSSSSTTTSGTTTRDTVADESSESEAGKGELEGAMGETTNEEREMIERLQQATASRQAWSEFFANFFSADGLRRLLAEYNQCRMRDEMEEEEEEGEKGKEKEKEKEEAEEQEEKVKKETIDNEEAMETQDDEEATAGHAEKATKSKRVERRHRREQTRTKEKELLLGFDLRRFLSEHLLNVMYGFPSPTTLLHVGEDCCVEADSRYHTLEYDFEDWLQAKKAEEEELERKKDQAAALVIGNSTEGQVSQHITNEVGRGSELPSLTSLSSDAVQPTGISTVEELPSSITVKQEPTSAGVEDMEHQPTSMIVAQEKLNQDLGTVLNKLKAYKEHSYPFLQAVTLREAPDYYDIIKKPMHFGTMEEKIASSEYKNKAMFQADIDLIVANCRTYNINPESIYRVHADKIERLANTLLAQLPDEMVLERDESTNPPTDSKNKPIPAAAAVALPLPSSDATTTFSGSSPSSKHIQDLEHGPHGLIPIVTLQQQETKLLSPPLHSTSIGGDGSELLPLEKQMNYELRRWRTITKDVRIKWMKYREAQLALPFSKRDALLRSPFGMSSFVALSGAMPCLSGGSNNDEPNKTEEAKAKRPSRPNFLFVPELSHWMDAVPDTICPPLPPPLSCLRLPSTSSKQAVPPREQQQEQPPPDTTATPTTALTHIVDEQLEQREQQDDKKEIKEEELLGWGSVVPQPRQEEPEKAPEFNVDSLFASDDEMQQAAAEAAPAVIPIVKTEKMESSQQLLLPTTTHPEAALAFVPDKEREQKDSSAGGDGSVPLAIADSSSSTAERQTGATDGNEPMILEQRGAVEELEEQEQEDLCDDNEPMDAISRNLVQLWRVQKLRHTLRKRMTQNQPTAATASSRISPLPSLPPPTALRLTPPSSISKQTNSVLLEKTLALLLSHNGFEGITTQAMAVLKDVFANYVLKFGQLLRMNEDHNCFASDPLPFQDVLLQSMDTMGVSTSELRDYVAHDLVGYGHELKSVEAYLRSKHENMLFNRNRNHHLPDERPASADVTEESTSTSCRDEAGSEAPEPTPSAFLSGQFGKAFTLDILGLRELGCSASVSSPFLFRCCGNLADIDVLQSLPSTRLFLPPEGGMTGSTIVRFAFRH
ncbi:Transcriptional activator spt7 [Balamuthia mandrillaris]